MTAIFLFLYLFCAIFGTAILLSAFALNANKPTPFNPHARGPRYRSTTFPTRNQKLENA